MKNTSILIAGGGFNGIYAAWNLARTGLDVTLLNASPKLGGVPRSLEWQNYWLDQGCQNLRLRNEDALRFYSDVLGDELKLLDTFTWATTLGEHWTPEFSWPDFSEESPDVAAKILEEMASIAARYETDTQAGSNATEDTHFLSAFEQRFGQSLTEQIIPMATKITGSDPALFSVDANSALCMLLRPQLGSDELMQKLKGNSEYWDRHLGVSARCADPRFLGDNTHQRFA